MLLLKPSGSVGQTKLLAGPPQVGETHLRQGSASSFQHLLAKATGREPSLTLSPQLGSCVSKGPGCCLGLYLGLYSRMGPWRLLWQTVWLDKKEQMKDLAPSPSFLTVSRSPDWASVPHVQSGMRSDALSGVRDLPFPSPLLPSPFPSSSLLGWCLPLRAG